MTKSTTPESALRSLIHYMTEMQRKTDEQQINPEARKGLAQWTLQEFLETLPDSLDRQKVHRPPRPHRHGTANGGGRGPNIHILNSAGQIVRSASHVVLDPAKPESTDGRREGWANWDEGAYKGESLGSIGTDVTRQRVFSSLTGPGERSIEAGNRVIVRSDAAGCTRGPGGREFGGVGTVADSAVRLGVGWLAVGPGRC